MPDFSVFTTFTAKDKFSSTFKTMGAASTKFGDNTSAAFKKASSSGTTFGGVLKGILAADVVRGGIRLLKTGIVGIVQQASLLEDAVTSFTTLTGSAQTAADTVELLNQTAASTPFEFTNLSDATKLLMGFEAVAQDDLIPTLRMLGDTAVGNAERFDRITLAYSQIQAAGKASMQDINQLVNAGVPILGAMADQLGLTIGEMREMVAAGAATGDVVTQAFKDMTSDGGLFFNGMEMASKTLTGRFSTFRDNVKLTAAAIGTALMPQLKTLVNVGIQLAQRIRSWAEANQEIIAQKIETTVASIVEGVKSLQPWIPKIVDGFDKLRAVFNFIKPIIPVMVGGLVAYSAAMKAIALFKFIGLMRKAIVAQGIFNAVMMLNPVGMVILGIVALIGIVILLVKHWDKVREVIGFTFQWWGEQFKKLWAWWSQIVVESTDWWLDVLGGVWEKLKSGFLLALEIIKKAFYTWANFFLATWGDIVKAVINTASKFGKLLGFDTEGLDKVVDTIDKLQTEVALRAEKPITPPNQTDVQAQNINFNGQLNISGAPAGSTVDTQTTGAPAVRTELLGANG